MLTLEGLIAVISLCLTAFSLGYMPFDACSLAVYNGK